VPQGKVKWFSTEKAFGFIEQENDNDIFVHVTGLADGVTAIDKDMLVEYEVEQGRKGPQATNVRPASGAAAPAAEAVEEAEVVEEVEVVEIEDEAGDVEIVEIDEEVVVEAEEEEEA
jgi:CspA family cold shock protein